ncbi:cytochrome d ubiquinol oxidase subunit II [Sneathiella sp.]|uniref:cytochrome d ubiquinol oxidase subunit II n=1 Tax=Sneathiella sp. TaxID=1964365 RepID=UPI0035694E43
MELDLPLIWAAIIAFAILAYVSLDGFDLGVGILFPFAPEKLQHRDLMMNSVAPIWDGNETWLVLGGGGLLAVFPLAYAVVLPALYVPIIAMLLGLIFRGVAFEFRWRASDRNRIWWDRSFAFGSLLAAVSQGVCLGALIQGIEVADRSFAGGRLDWLTPFSLLTGGALVVGYVMLGATWLVMKTEGELQIFARKFAMISGFLTMALIGLVSLVTPFLDAEYHHRWFEGGNLVFSVIVPFLLAVCAVIMFLGLKRHHDKRPFFAAHGIFFLCYVGIGISFYPRMVPPDLTIWAAAAPDKSLGFLLVGTVFLIPMIIAYTAYSYWVFRGKVDPNSGYH